MAASFGALYFGVRTYKLVLIFHSLIFVQVDSRHCILPLTLQSNTFSCWIQVHDPRYEQLVSLPGCHAQCLSQKRRKHPEEIKVAFRAAPASDGKESASSAGDWGLIPESGRIPWRRQCNPLQHSCPEDVMDRWAWRAELDPLNDYQFREGSPLGLSCQPAACTSISHTRNSCSQGPGDVLRVKGRHSRGTPASPHMLGTHPELPDQLTQFYSSLLITQHGISDCSSNYA